MKLSLFGTRGARSSAAPLPRRATPAPHFRPAVETLEGRVVPSAAPALTPAFGAALFSHGGHHHQGSSLFPISVTGVTAQGGQLVAQGLIGDQPFSAPVTLSAPAAAAPTAAARATPILDLHVGAINLDVLGLVVQTSPICLTVSAQPGPGNLLGNLLSDVANLLNGGLNLGDILGQLTATQLSRLTNGVTSLLNGVLDRLTSPAALSPTATNILHLSLGPVDLNLLGLKVHLDNCSNGPITLDVSAQPGAGNLLGNLLSGLAGLLDSTPLPLRVIDRVLADLAGEILGLV